MFVVPGDGMNAYMVYKVTTKVRKAFGLWCEMLWIFWTEHVTLVLSVFVSVDQPVHIQQRRGFGQEALQ